MTTRQARKIIRRIRHGAHYPERTRDRAAGVVWRNYRRRVRWAIPTKNDDRAGVLNAAWGQFDEIVALRESDPTDTTNNMENR